MAKLVLTIRGRTSQLSIEADSIDALRKELASINLSDQVISQIISESVGNPNTPKNQETIIQQEEPLNNIPSTPVSDPAPTIVPSNGTTKNIKILFDTPWGMKPRPLGEISSALESNSIYDSPMNISSALSKLVKKRYLKKMKFANEMKYFRPPNSSSVEESEE